ncbi:cell division topological specificity factor MinE [Desulfovibrio inopinatus]|uniref:cell division topological specificity factor MinE n=1 Tax=Desulfovibrio inopinatus TaxID=102109 RepID=UPI000413533E|nr:cell division topological specificity factor MinE [Desulfovibrio inopinatus]
MKFLEYFRSKKTSACVAKERLQIIVAHERAQNSGHEYLPLLQHELLEVVRKYINVDDNAVKIEIDRDGECDILELNIFLPDKS